MSSEIKRTIRLVKTAKWPFKSETSEEKASKVIGSLAGLIEPSDFIIFENLADNQSYVEQFQVFSSGDSVKFMINYFNPAN